MGQPYAGPYLSSGGLQRAEVNTLVNHSSFVAPIFDHEGKVHEFFGEVSTSSFESDLHERNNTDRIWSSPTAVSPSTFNAVQAKGEYSVKVSVDNHHPSPGGTVNFTITAIHATDLPHSVIDQKVAIELTDGLTVDPAGTISYDPATRAASVIYNNGVFNIGTREVTGSSRIPQHSVTLPIRVSSDAIVNEQCLTATITGNPPPGTGPRDDDISDNVSKVCLGDQPVEPFVSGPVDAFSVYPCVGDTDPPCDSTDDVRVRAVDTTGRAGPSGTALLWVNPATARKYDGKTGHSVNDGDTVSWQTSVAAGSSYTAGLINGLELYYSRAQFAGHESDWKRPIYGISARNAEGNIPPPGKVFSRSTSSGNELRKADSSNNYKELSSTLSNSAMTASEFHYFLEFEKLGTYKVTWHVALKRGSGTHGSENCHPDSSTPPVNQAFCAEETYTFHVGPMADLAVEDGDQSGRVAADRSALSIVAVNNGPDHSLGARVTELPTGAEVIHISQGSYDGTAGAWDIGALKHKDARRSAGKSEHATLILSASARDDTKVKITSSKDYEVCIGGKDNPGDLAHTTQEACEADTATGVSWHSTPVYDYNSGNNTAKITAVEGTGIGPDIPANVTTQTGATTVTWDEVEYLHGLPVARYQLEWLGGDWTMLADAVIENEFVDAAPTGRRAYRVRAVNAAGVTGPWSRSSVQAALGSPGPPQNVSARADGNNAIDVSWASPEDAGNSPVTGYRVEWTADPEAGRWSGANTTELTYKHRNLQTAATWHYRVAARNRGGLGVWSDPVMGTTAPNVPDAPGNFRATTLSDYEIELTWNEPKDNGEPITGYQLERSRDGSADSWSQRATPGADATTHTDSTLDANTRYYYRIRAVNSVGGGAWSRSVSAMTQLTPPDAPSLTSVEADGPNAIIVSWEEPWYLGDLPVTQYQVQWAKDQYSEIWRGPQTLSGSARSWRHTGLKPDETWYYQVRASNGGGRWSVWSYISAATTASEKVPTAAPSGLTATYDTASDSVTLKWNAPSGSAEITGYDLQYSEDSSQWEDLEENLNALAYTDDGYHLYPAAQIHYRVRARSAEGAGPWSRSVRVSVPADPPDAPRIMWVEADGSNHIYLEWDVPYYDGGTAITGYGLLWCRALDGADENPCEDAMEETNSPADPRGYRRISLGASQRSYTHSVSPGYYYYYLLRATNGGNRWSEWRQYDFNYARTYAGVPAAPSLRAQAVDASQIKVTWSKPSSSGSEISNYWLYVYENGEDLHDWDNILDIVTVPGDRTEWTIGELSPETTRYFRIRALNDNGEGKYSALRQATTPSG